MNGIFCVIYQEKMTRKINQRIKRKSVKPNAKQEEKEREQREVETKGKKAEEEMELKKVELLADGKTIALHIPNLKPVHMAQIDYNIKSAKGEEIKGRIDHTIHVVE